MCGINAIIQKSHKPEASIKNELLRMNELIFHRGPDEGGVMTHSSDNFALGMAMRRLSIIDLSTGQQPVFSDDEKIALVFNGEIYNYRELKADLKQKGVEFKTSSDTEVILRIYETDGEKGFEKLDGMFGFSLFDSTKNKVFICRDYFGEKPIYYYNTNETFLVASELKSIIDAIDVKPEISLEGLNLFFRLTYIPSPYTIYKGIYKLPPNSMLVYDLEKHDFEITNISTEEKPEKIDISFNDAKKKVRELVSESVSSRSIADVPLGTFLSGGVDSSIISLCLAKDSNQKINTFSIGFEKESFNETDKSQLVAKLINSNHNEFVINENNLRDAIDNIVLNFDEPFADASSLATYLVSKKTREYVKVALTGDGGDEVFGGYNKYYVGKMNTTYTSIIPRGIHNIIDKTSNTLLARKDDNRGFRYKLNKLIKSISYEDDHYWGIISLSFNDEDISNFFLEKNQVSGIFDYYRKSSGIERPKTLDDFKTIDRHMSLEGDMLVKVDRTSMLNSLECRAPFLNKKLYDFVASLPSDFLLKKWSKKHILKEAFKEDFPEGFLEKSKRGFGVPVGDWLRGSLKNELTQMIDTKFLEEQSIFEVVKIQEFIKNHITGKADNAFKAWAYYCFQKWYINTYRS